MADKNTYVITRAEISLDGGLKVIADLDSTDGVRKLVEDLQAAGLKLSAGVQPERHETPARTLHAELEDPALRIETQVGLEPGRLSEAKILAIKDGVPQILRSTIFNNVTEAILVLMLALEVGLKQNPVNYEDFSALFDSQNLRSGSPLSMLITNVRNAGYLDNRIYSEGRRLRLTAKGQRKAFEVLKRLVTGSTRSA